MTADASTPIVFPDNRSRVKPSCSLIAFAIGSASELSLLFRYAAQRVSYRLRHRLALTIDQKNRRRALAERQGDGETAEVDLRAPFSNPDNRLTRGAAKSNRKPGTYFDNTKRKTKKER